MSHDCRGHDHAPAHFGAFRRVLWIALVLNGAMFAIEVAAGLAAHSVALQADALDFLGDSANYAVSLLVLGMVPAWRSRAALLKALSMAAFGLWVLGASVANALAGVSPHAPTMGAVGALALTVNVGVALLLYRFRVGDSNTRSVWLCSRNDAIGNLAVLAAALGVAGTGTLWPDLVVALVMACLALHASMQVASAALRELARSRENARGLRVFPSAE